jgi:hypothetical protein
VHGNSKLVSSRKMQLDFESPTPDSVLSWATQNNLAGFYFPDGLIPQQLIIHRLKNFLSGSDTSIDTQQAINQILYLAPLKQDSPQLPYRNIFILYPESATYNFSDLRKPVIEQKSHENNNVSHYLSLFLVLRELATLNSKLQTHFFAKPSYEELEQVVADRQSVIKEKESLIARQMHLIDEKDTLIARHIQMIQEKDTLIARHTQSIHEKDSLIEKHIRLLHEKDALIAEQNENHNNEMQSSMSEYTTKLADSEDELLRLRDHAAQQAQTIKELMEFRTKVMSSRAYRIYKRFKS